MSKLMARFPGFKRANTCREANDEIRPSVSPPQVTPLLLLSPDAAGPAVLRATPFEDAEALADYVLFWFPPRDRSRLIAFWALPERPADPTEPAEALVLMRDPRDPGLVCPFSFVDMETALDFLRDEARRGLDLSLVSLYWAVPAVIETTAFSTVRVLPPQPPAVAHAGRELPDARILEAAGVTSGAATGKGDAVTPPSQKEVRPTPAFDDMLREISNALRASDGPRPAFDGFGSAPGRF